jgi:drug/metabolite transporter (DMT)-like permease
MELVIELIALLFRRMAKGDPIAWGIFLVLGGGFFLVASYFLVDLLKKGDAWAWTIVIGLGSVAILLVTASVLIHRKHKREDEERQKKWLKKNQKVK